MFKNLIVDHNAYFNTYHFKRKAIKYNNASGSQLPILYKLAYLSSMLNPQLSKLPYLPQYHHHQQQEQHYFATSVQFHELDFYGTVTDVMVDQKDYTIF